MTTNVRLKFHISGVLGVAVGVAVGVVVGVAVG